MGLYDTLYWSRGDEDKEIQVKIWPDMYLREYRQGERVPEFFNGTYAIAHNGEEGGFWVIMEDILHGWVPELPTSVTHIFDKHGHYVRDLEDLQNRWGYPGFELNPEWVEAYNAKMKERNG